MVPDEEVIEMYEGSHVPLEQMSDFYGKVTWGWEGRGWPRVGQAERLPGQGLRVLPPGSSLLSPALLFVTTP